MFGLWNWALVSIPCDLAGFIVSNTTEETEKLNAVNSRKYEELSKLKREKAKRPLIKIDWKTSWLIAMERKDWWRFLLEQLFTV